MSKWPQKILTSALESLRFLVAARCRVSYGLAVRHVLYAVIMATLILVACMPKVEPPVTAPHALVRIQPKEFPDFSDDMSYSSLRKAISESLNYYKRVDASTPFRFGPDVFTASHLVRSMERFDEIIGGNPSSRELRDAVEASFWVYRSVGSNGVGEVLFTGYFEPTLRGSLRPSLDYPYPIYRRPDDWVSVDLGRFNSKYEGERIVGQYVNKTVIPYFSREDIDRKGYLRQQGYELLWLSDQIDRFFLHTQGSGRVLLEDGTVLHLNYDCSNGRPYRSIGRLLVHEGRISSEDISMQKIRAYLTDHPEETQRVLNHNESYIFFRLVDQGPLGAIEIPLTPCRSVATDLELFPKCALAYIQTEKPVVAEAGGIYARKKFGRFVLNQDTGAAIQGPGRIDLFWGNGSYAEIAAGHMKHKGTILFLVLKKAKQK